jgi:hypothetical protein
MAVTTVELMLIVAVVLGLVLGLWVLAGITLDVVRESREEDR